MSNPLLPTDIFDELAAIRRRLDTLERSTGNQQGLNLSDANGVQRVLIGKLPSGDYGIQVNDPSGTLLLDSAGLAGVATILAQASSSSAFNTPGIGTTFVNIPGVNAGFAVTNRPKTVLILVDAPCAATTAAGGANGMMIGVSCYIGAVGGTVYRQSITHPLTFDAEAQGVTVPMFLTLPVGSYSVSLTAGVGGSGTGTFYLWSWSLLVLQLGG